MGSEPQKSCRRESASPPPCLEVALDMTWWRLAGLVIFGTGLTILGFGLDHLGVGLHRLLMLMGIPITIVGWVALLWRPIRSSVAGRGVSSGAL